jgi:predicted  nucleic acid-binding Zn-ribbon protein
MLRIDAQVVLTAALATCLLSSIGCGWVDKTVECRSLTEVSQQWGQKAETFGNDLEADVMRQLQSLEEMDMTSRNDLVHASRALRDASETLETRADGFFGEVTDNFETLQLTDPQLLSYRAHYVAQVDEVGTRIHEMTAVIRHLGQILGKLDPRWLESEHYVRKLEKQMADVETRIGSAEQKLDESMQAEEVLIEQINAYCEPTVPPRRIASL